MKVDQVFQHCFDHGMTLVDIEKRCIEAALRRANKDKEKAAEILGLKISVMGKKIHTYGFKPRIKHRGKYVGINTLNQLGQILRSAREKKNFALKTVAYELGYKNPDFISKMELGRKPLPKKIIPKIAQLLEIDLAVLEKAIQESRI